MFFLCYSLLDLARIYKFLLSTAQGDFLVIRLVFSRDRQTAYLRLAEAMKGTRYLHSKCNSTCIDDDALKFNPESG